MILGDQVLLTGTPEDKLLAGKLFADGNSCTDNNENTINDIYISGTCIGKLVVNPSCTDETMNWNTTNNLCEKGENYSYLAKNTVAGYTITGDSLAGRNIGLKKNGNSFYMYESDGNPTTGASIYLKIDGTLSSNTYTTNSFFILTGFAGYNQGTGQNGTTIYRIGSSISESSIYNSYSTNYFSGLIKIDENTFKFMYNYAGTIIYGNHISFEPFYSGEYTCPSGGTINTLETAQGICKTGYTLTNNKCVQN